MILKKIVLENYRNYNSENIELNKGVNLILGENAQGKTNFLEAVYYLATGRTFRNNKDVEIINWEKDYFRIQTELLKDNTDRKFIIDIYCDRKGNKQIKINGIKLNKISELFGYLQVIIFSPDDLKIIKGGPGERRKYIDLEICQLISGYYNILTNYYRVLQQRNNMLKEIRNNKTNKQLIEIWNEQLINYGSKIIKNRIDFLKKLVPLARKIQKEITLDKENLDITYNSLLVNKSSIELKEIENNFFNIIKNNQEQEIKKGITLFGPHRDDIIFYINNKELKTYGSQGQQRTVILSLKLAELKLFFYNSDNYPLLLLDDVMSELDDKRRDFLIKLIKNNNIQTIITGANNELMDQNIKEEEIYNVEKGKICGPRRN